MAVTVTQPSNANCHTFVYVAAMYERENMLKQWASEVPGINEADLLDDKANSKLWNYYVWCSAWLQAEGACKKDWKIIAKYVKQSAGG